MSIEEKAKAYDEALERAKEIKSKILSSHLSTESCKAVSEYIDTIIPELAESEDERIRKTLCEYISDTMCDEDHELYHISKGEALAYLEKHKPVEWRPSDEQIKAMGYFVRKHQATANHATTTWSEFEAFKSLYQDLKKL